MRRIKLLLAILPILILFVGCSDKSNVVDSSSNSTSLTQFVDPFIGTGGHGHTFPGAAYPFGQIQLSPDNKSAGWDWVSGYHDRDSTVVGFSHLHLSGTGIGDLCELSIMPTSLSVENSGKDNNEFIEKYIGYYKKSDEVAKPGYYKVSLDNQGVVAELSVSERVGYHKYQFEKSNDNSIIVNLGYAKNWDSPVDTEIEFRNETMVTGMRKSKGWAVDQHLYFVIEFSKPIVSNKQFATGSKAAKVGVFGFEGNNIELRVAISSVSVEGAMKNLKAEKQKWDFASVVESADKAWNDELSTIKVETIDDESKRVFYTALYHTKIAPALFSDVDSKFKGVKGDVQSCEGYKRYTVFSLWDTYRTLHPLFTITNPNQVNDMVKSMLDHFRQTGALPIWELEGNETGCMVGNHSISVIAEAIVKGIGDFDKEEAFNAMKVTSMRADRGMKYHDELGYIPSDLENESVAKALEYMVDDWAVAASAKKLGKEADYNYFVKRSKNYVNYWDSKTQFFRGKLEDGSWRVPFVPTESVHRDNDYTEGNAWQYLWLVPHDPEGLIDLFGSKEAFVTKLDSLFTLENGLTGGTASPDITGLIGAYAHGNEPGHHTTYLYNYAGEYGKTAEKLHQIFNEMYRDEPNGLEGNEDCGQMSAWYVMSSLGFYPVNPSSAQYQLGSPNLKHAVLSVGNGEEFIVTTENFSSANIYPQEVFLNGVRLTKSYISHRDVMSGGELKFVMGAAPNSNLYK